MGKKPAGPASRRLRKAIYDFHVRAFGEEMARVNHLPLAARRRYIAEMVDHAAQKGHRLFFLGSTDEVLGEACARAQAAYTPLVPPESLHASAADTATAASKALPPLASTS